MGSAAALARLLDRERQALLQGRWDGLEKLGAEKARLFDRLRESDAEPAALQRLAAQVQRNQRLLKAAIAGTGDAVARLKAMRDAQTTLRTYDATGQGSDLATPARGLERKA